MRQSSKRLTSLSLAIIFLFASFFIYFYLIQPSYENIQKVRAEVYGREQILKNKRKVVDQVKETLSQLEGQEEVREAISLAIPPGPNQSEVANQINALATKNQLAVQFLSASAPSVQAVREVSETSSEGEFRVKPLGVLGFQVKVAGTYNNFKSFISALENNIRVIDIKNVVVEPLGKSNQDFYSFTITVTTYYQNP